MKVTDFLEEQPLQQPSAPQPGTMTAPQAAKAGQFPMDTTKKTGLGLTQDLTVVMSCMAAASTPEQLTNLMRKIYPIMQKQKAAGGQK